MASPSPSHSPLPLSGVRIFLHIRNPSTAHRLKNATPSKKNNNNNIRNASATSNAGRSAKVVLRAARAQVQQLGATLALSEAAADLVIFYHGSPDFLEALHARYKAVVSPAYLDACVEANQRVSITPYVVPPGGDVTPTSVSAGPAPPTSPTETQKAESRLPSSEKTKSRTRSPPSSGCGKKASRRVELMVATAATPADVAIRRKLLLLDDEDGSEGEEDVKASQQEEKEELSKPLFSSDEKIPSTRHEATAATRSRRTSTVQSPTSVTPAPPPTNSCAELGESAKQLATARGGLGRSRKTAAERISQSAKRTRSKRERSPSPAVSLAQPSHESVADSSASATPQLTPSFAVTQEMPTITTHASLKKNNNNNNNSHANGTSFILEKRGNGNYIAGNFIQIDQATREVEEGEEEARIRHAVLRSTATAAITRRRRERPPQLKSTVASTAVGPATSGETEEPPSLSLMHDFCYDRPAKKLKGQPADPFLSSTSSMDVHHLHPSASSMHLSGSDASSLAVTQPLSSQDPPTTADVWAAPSSHGVVRSASTAQRTSSAGAARQANDRPPGDDAPEHVKETEADDVVFLSTSSPKQKQKLLPRRCSSSSNAAHTRAEKKQRRKVKRASREFVDVAPEPPLHMSFSDTTALHRLPVDEAAEVRVRFFIDEDGDTNALLTFLTDVTVQLGASVVETSDTQWFGRSSHTSSDKRRTLSSTGRHRKGKATHLVVSSNAVLTPETLYFKALGIPIVTPQWVYDAVVLGGFPVVVPHLHAHPVFGDLAAPTAEAAVTATGRGEEEIAVDVPADTESAADLLGDEVGFSHQKAVPVVSPTLPSATAARAAAGSGVDAAATHLTGRTATLRQLHKEVVDEYVPAGEQAKRPYYLPIFQDCMFYLYVPPMDLAVAHHHPPSASRSVRNAGSYLGDVTAALEQATHLIRLLGGTVTRNLASTYLDVVVDLTGFYERTIEAGQQQQQQQQQQQEQQNQAPQRLLRESLSCAYHDALQRLSELPATYAASQPDARTTPTTTTRATTTTHRLHDARPPVVGISWLLYSILQRRRADVAAFVLADHPLSAQLAAVHNEPTTAMTSRSYITGKGKAKEEEIEKGTLTTVNQEPASVRVATPTFSTTSTSSSSSSTPVASASPSSSLLTSHTASSPPAAASPPSPASLPSPSPTASIDITAAAALSHVPSIRTTERSVSEKSNQASALSPSPWPSVEGESAFAATQASQRARKHSLQQLDTQEIAKLLETSYPSQ